MSTRAPQQHQAKPLNLKDHQAPAETGTTVQDEQKKQAGLAATGTVAERDRSVLLSTFDKDRGLGEDRTLGASLLFEARERIETLKELFPNRSKLWEGYEAELRSTGFTMGTGQVKGPEMTLSERAKLEERFINMLGELRGKTSRREVFGYLKGKEERELHTSCVNAFNAISANIPMGDELGDDIRTKLEALNVSIPNLGGQQEMDLLRVRTQIIGLLDAKGLLKDKDRAEMGRILDLMAEMGARTSTKAA